MIASIITFFNYFADNMPEFLPVFLLGIILTGGAFFLRRFNNDSKKAKTHLTENEN